MKITLQGIRARNGSSDIFEDPGASEDGSRLSTPTVVVAPLLENEAKNEPQCRSRKALSYKEQGNAAHKRREYAVAIRHFSNALTLRPDEPFLHSNRSASYEALGQYSQALADADAALIFSDNLLLKGHWRRAKALMGLRCWSAASQSCSFGLQLKEQKGQQQLEQMLAEAEKQASQDEQSTPRECLLHLKVAKREIPLIVTLCDGAAILMLIATVCHVPAERMRVVHKGALLTPENLLQRLNQVQSTKKKVLLQVIGRQQEDETGCHPDDILLLMDQLNFERERAISLLKQADGDVIQAIASTA